MTPQLHTELWTSWASLLRSYAAAHGLNSTHHAVVEVSAAEIIVRVGIHWLRFTWNAVQHDDTTSTDFSLNEDGTVSIAGEAAEEMDLAAERLARGLFAENA
jgi:hypothetical protein